MAVSHVTYINKFSSGIEGFENIAKNETLSKKDLRVFIFLCCRLESKHYRKIDKSAIAESLHMDKKDVKSSIESLVNAGIICHGSDSHVNDAYRFTYTEDDDGDGDYEPYV